MGLAALTYLTTDDQPLVPERQPPISSLASFGLAVHGPIGHYFYGFLDERFPKKDAQTVAIKVLIDQVRARHGESKCVSCHGSLN